MPKPQSNLRNSRLHVGSTAVAYAGAGRLSDLTVEALISVEPMFLRSAININYINMLSIIGSAGPTGC
jgi:hypothetical protein